MALCFMGNHFHFVLETPQANLVAGMQWFLGTYTGRFNRRHQLFGHLFSGRYKALIVDGGFGAEHYGEERRAGEEERAELLVQAGLRKARWQEADLGRTRKGEPVKVKLARQLREQTTMTHEWIAHRLRMGSRSNVSNLVYSEVQRTQKWKK
jgi:REP element-mobilizing transposase RayT